MYVEYCTGKSGPMVQPMQCPTCMNLSEWHQSGLNSAQHIPVDVATSQAFAYM